MKKIAFQGIHGAFHEEAIFEWKTDGLQSVPCMTFKEVVQAVENGSCEYGILAVENTIAGTIPANLDMIAEGRVKTCGEVTIRIRQQLGALPGTSLSDLREVRSHYMAINQCRTFFSAFPGIALVEDVDTALSARDVSWKKLRHVGAIGSQKAMRQYGLHILAEDIESDKNNYTRFLVISSEDAGSWNA